MKLHIGAGAVYLLGWLNIDVPNPKTFLASQRPDLVERWGTTEDQYYARHADKDIEALKDGPLEQDYVCDRYGDFFEPYVVPGHADEILARHSFEHLSQREAHRALEVLGYTLQSGGLLRLDVPDHVGTLELYRRTGHEFYIRHLVGPRRNDFGYHLMSYRRDRFQALVESHGFRFVSEETNIHFYPAFCLRFQKQ